MLFWTVRQRWRKHLQPLVRIPDVLTWTLMGLWFGTVLVFGWRRSFQMPLVVINVGAFAGALLIQRAFRTNRKNTHGKRI
jgi:hypothetical protein